MRSRSMLESSGCTLVRAQSADEALLAMLRHEFAAMMLDIRMPGHERHRAGARWSSSAGARRDVPILFLTAHSWTKTTSCAGTASAPWTT